MRSACAVLVPALATVLAAVLAAGPAAGRASPPAFAEPGDIVAAESGLARLVATRGIRAAIRATATADAQIFAPQAARAAAAADHAAIGELAAQRHLRELWMSCDGSIAVAHGDWQRDAQGAGPGAGQAGGWYVTVWQRQKGGGYRWILEQGGAAATAPRSDMIAAGLADCPPPPARGSGGRAGAPPPDRRRSDPGADPAADHASGRADDRTLEWTTTLAADDGRVFTLRIERDGGLREVLRATAAPPGG